MFLVSLDTIRLAQLCRYKPFHNRGRCRAIPTLSTFYGIVILMYFDDHNPPHFHVRYAGSKAIVEIHTLRVISGSLPAPRIVSS